MDLFGVFSITVSVGGFSVIVGGFFLSLQLLISLICILYQSAVSGDFLLQLGAFPHSLGVVVDLFGWRCVLLQFFLDLFGVRSVTVSVEGILAVRTEEFILWCPGISHGMGY